MSYHWMLVGLLALPCLAAADTVTFKNGSRLEGIAIVRGDSLEVRVPEGSLFFSRTLVKEIVTEKTPLAEYERRVRELTGKDAKAAYELGLFCETNGLRQQAEALFKQTLALAPTHEGARDRLGYKKIGNRWVTPAELLTELGMVQVKGEWMSARAAREFSELDERTRRLESRLASMEQNSGELKRTLDDERRATDRAERVTDLRLEQLEAEKKRLQQEAQQPVYYYSGYYPYGFATTRRRSGVRVLPSPEPTVAANTAFGIPPANKSIFIP